MRGVPSHSILSSAPQTQYVYANALGVEPASSPSTRIVKRMVEVIVFAPFQSVDYRKPLRTAHRAEELRDEERVIGRRARHTRQERQFGRRVGRGDSPTQIVDEGREAQARACDRRQRR